MRFSPANWLEAIVIKGCEDRYNLFKLGEFETPCSNAFTDDSSQGLLPRYAETICAHFDINKYSGLWSKVSGLSCP